MCWQSTEEKGFLSGFGREGLGWALKDRSGFAGHKEEEEPRIALDQGFLMMIYVESAGNWKLAKSEAGSTGWDQTV